MWLLSVYIYIYIGTHGHMKCVFDGQLKAQDTVLLNLYKRVFPKWTFADMSEKAAFERGIENGGETAMEEDNGRTRQHNSSMDL